MLRIRAQCPAVGRRQRQPVRRRHPQSVVLRTAHAIRTALPVRRRRHDWRSRAAIHTRRHELHYGPSGSAGSGKVAAASRCCAVRLRSHRVHPTFRSAGCLQLVRPCSHGGKGHVDLVRQRPHAHAWCVHRPRSRDLDLVASPCLLRFLLLTRTTPDGSPSPPQSLGTISALGILGRS